MSARPSLSRRARGRFADGVVLADGDALVLLAIERGGTAVLLPSTGKHRHRPVPGCRRLHRQARQLRGSPSRSPRSRSSASAKGRPGTSLLRPQQAESAKAVERADDGRVVDVRKLSLARRWCADYGLASSNQAVPMLAARGIDQVLSGLRRYEGSYTITAEAATRPYLPRGQAAVAPLALLTIYVPDATAAAGSLQLRPAERGANVVLVEPFDEVVYRGAQVKDRLSYAAPSQVIADLLTGPGRAPEEGASLLEVLASKDEGWTR